MIYRVHLYEPKDGSCGYEFFVRKGAAESRLRDWCKQHPEASESTISTITTARSPHTQAAVLALLRDWANHPNNG